MPGNNTLSVANDVLNLQTADGQQKRQTRKEINRRDTLSDARETRRWSRSSGVQCGCGGRGKGSGLPTNEDKRERERGRENPSVAAPEGVVGPSLTSCSLSYRLDFVRWLRATESQGDAHAPPLTMSLCKTWLAKITRKSAQ